MIRPMEETAREILDRLLLEYADDAEAVRLLTQSYDEILSYPEERAVLLAKDAERTLSLYF